MTGLAGLRLFVAVDPPALVREALAGWAREALGTAGPRLVGADQLHITLAFMESVGIGDTGAVARLALGCARPVADLRVGVPLSLPPRRPRVLAVSIQDPDGALGALHGQVNSALSAGLGFEAERRRFTPHVTVARMRPDGHRGGSGALKPTPALAFAAQSLTVYRSRLSPAGAEYEALDRVALS